jgi:hypothetical protein
MTNVLPSAPAEEQHQPPMPNLSRRPPGLALLATLLFNPIILVGYYLYLYGPGNTCVAGSYICSFGDYPAIVQVGVILAGCLAIWFLLYLLARWLVETPYSERNALVHGLRAITDVSKMRPLLLVYGLLLVVGLIVGLVKRQLSPPIVVLCLFTAFACLHSALRTTSAEGGESD